MGQRMAKTPNKEKVLPLAQDVTGDQEMVRTRCGKSLVAELIGRPGGKLPDHPTQCYDDGYFGGCTQPERPAQ